MDGHTNRSYWNLCILVQKSVFERSTRREEIGRERYKLFFFSLINESSKPEMLILAKGPVFSYVAATLNGITTIRSANAEELLKREFDILQDQHTATWYLLLVLFDAFGFFLNTITIVFLFILTFQSLFDVNGELISMLKLNYR